MNRAEIGERIAKRPALLEGGPKRSNLSVVIPCKMRAEAVCVVVVVVPVCLGNLCERKSGNGGHDGNEGILAYALGCSMCWTVAWKDHRQ